MSWCRGACANCQVLTPDKQVSRGDICLHNMCCTAKLFWFYYGSRISPITLIFLLRALATRRWRSLRIPWALHAHSIRKLRHLHVAKARSKQSVRSVRSVSFNIIIVLPNNNVYTTIFCATSYPYFFNCTICLHPTLFTCTALIFSLLRSVGSIIFHLHATCTFLCTCLHTNASTALLPRSMTQCPHADGWTITGGSRFGCSNPKIAPPYAEKCEWYAPSCKQVQTCIMKRVQTNVDKCRRCAGKCR